MVWQLFKKTYFFTPFLLDLAFVGSMSVAFATESIPTWGIISMSVAYATLSLGLLVIRLSRSFAPFRGSFALPYQMEHALDTVAPPPSKSWTDRVRAEAAARLLKKASNYQDILNNQGLFKAIQEANSLDIADNEYRRDTAERCLAYLCKVNDLPKKEG